MAQILKILSVIFSICFLITGTASAQLVSPIKFIQIDELPVLSLNTLGTKQILPQNIWSKSDSQKLSDLIEKTSKKNLSPALREKVIALLLTDTGDVRLNNIPDSDRFLMTRISALLEMGAFNQALELLSIIPNQKLTPKFLRLKIITQILAGQTNEACVLTETPALKRMADEMRLTCLMAQGDMTKAKIAYAVYKEEGGKDKTLVALADRIFEETKDPLPNIKTFTAWHIYFLAALGDKMPDLSTQPVWLKKALASHKNVPIATRISFAERTGVSWKELATLYQSVFPQTPETNSAITRAHLYQKMTSETDAVEKAKTINRFLDSARNDNLFKDIATVTEEFLLTITPAKSNIFLAFNATQVFALTDNLSMAYPWYKELENSTDIKHQETALLLSPLMNKMGAGQPKEIDSLLTLCQEKPSPYCTHFMEILPDDFPVKDPELLMKLSGGIKTSHNQLTKMALQNMIKDGKTGEAVLWTAILLTDSENYEKPLLDAFALILPQYLSKSVVVERMVY